MLWVIVMFYRNRRPGARAGIGVDPSWYIEGRKSIRDLRMAIEARG
jgi:hypothetical protein